MSIANSGNVCVFYFCIFSSKLDLFEILHFTIEVDVIVGDPILNSGLVKLKLYPDVWLKFQLN
jgi:hypothetical protein